MANCCFVDIKYRRTSTLEFVHFFRGNIQQIIRHTMMLRTALLHQRSRNIPKARPAVMAAVHKALYSWFTLLVFLILLVLRADQKVDWNWFLIFIPLWLFDTVVVTYIIVNIIIHFRSAYCANVDRNDMTKNRKYGLLTVFFLKIGFQVLLCLRLENFDLSLYYVLIPFWMMLIAGLVDNFRVLIANHHYW